LDLAREGSETGPDRADLAFFVSSDASNVEQPDRPIRSRPAASLPDDAKFPALRTSGECCTITPPLTQCDPEELACYAEPREID
jgi:hypothetical protein